VSGTFPVEDAVRVYDRLSSGELHGVGFLFEYPGNADIPEQKPRPTADASQNGSASIVGPRIARRPGATLGVGFIGAGNYASSMLLPHLLEKPSVKLRHVATNRSLSSLDAKRRFGFEEASTDADAVLEDEKVDAVFVVTRHHSHAELTCRALRAGKAVFVEKPLALSESELQEVLDTIAETGNDRLMVGFNRRFSPMLKDMRSRFGAAAGGGVARYAVNAGQLGARSWYNDTKLEGSRFEGEGGHFIDTLSWWFGALPTEVFAVGAKDPHDLVVNLKFDDGSLGVISYVTNGNSRYPKEILEVSASGRSARMDNFKRATVWSGRRKRVARVLGAVDKGQEPQVLAFVEAVRNETAMPISVDSLVATTRATLAVAESQASGRPEPT
jgi:predicted dehydrogenase